ncbi:MAG: leucine-rich repeat domain-containing protein [Treponema sp.]|nr:leucine-rich repeat domain-containing protein [Treponema sp.]
MLKFLPEKYKTVKMCFEMVRNDVSALEYVPENFKTAELCLEVVRDNGMALIDVPEELQSQVKTTLEKSGVFIHYEGDGGDVLIPKGITAIAKYVFYGKEITHITFPEGLASIGEDAFYECRDLTSIYIPKSVIEIGENAFHDCNSLQTIYMSRKTALKYNIDQEGPFHGCPGEDHIRYYEDEDGKNEHI